MWAIFCGLKGRVPSRGQNIEVAFQPMPTVQIRALVQPVNGEPEHTPSAKAAANQEPHSIFGSHPNTPVADFNLEKEVECLSFKLNLGDIPLDKEHQAKYR